jgi:hypothetical protein
MYPRGSTTPLPLPLRDAAGDLVTVASPGDVTVTVSKDGASFGAAAGTVGVDSGDAWYTPAASETNGQSIRIKAAHASAKTLDFTVYTDAKDANGRVDVSRVAGQTVNASSTIEADRINNVDVAVSTRNAVAPPDAASIAAAVELAILDEGDATALMAAIAAKVEEFLVNDGDASATLQAIATAVWANASRTLTAGVNLVQINGTSIAGTGTQVADAFVHLLNVATPAKTINDIGTASGSGSNHTAEDVAALILQTPANKLVTSGTGAVTVGTNNDKSGYQIAGSKNTLDDLQDLAAGAAMTLTSGERISLAAALEAAIINELDGTAVMQAIADLIADDMTTGDLSVQAIAAAVRDAVLDRVLAGNHDGAGSTGQVLQDLLDRIGQPTAIGQPGQATLADMLYQIVGTSSFDITTDTLPHLRDHVQATIDAVGGLAIPSAASNASAVQSQLDDDFTAILAGLQEMQGAAFDTATDSLEAIRDRGDAAWTTGAGGGGGGVAGPGGTEWDDLTVTNNGLPVDGVAVWITTDAAGSNVIAGPLYTTVTGQLPEPFMLESGQSYYVWLQRSPINFPNPTQITVP